MPYIQIQNYCICPVVFGINNNREKSHQNCYISCAFPNSLASVIKYSLLAVFRYNKISSLEIIFYYIF
jgi:hypothetical protein